MSAVTCGPSIMPLLRIEYAPMDVDHPVQFMHISQQFRVLLVQAA